MPANRNALIRYKTIDKCLQNRYRKWTLEDLIDACSDSLYEYEGIDKGVSKRTIQGDIQIMRSDKLGYNAPIIVSDKKFYTYEEKDYSITNIPLSEQDLAKLTETVEFLKQFQGFSHFKSLSGMVQKLEDHIYSQKEHKQPVIDFEKNENLKGLEYLDIIYKAIISEKSILLTYKSFKARNESTFNFHPYLLKEFRNRWFVLGIKNAKSSLLNLALDRIIELAPGTVSYIQNKTFDPSTHFNNTIGVTVSPNLEPEKVILFVNNLHKPYLLTKPLHHSQKIEKVDNFGATISINVQHNFELEKEILAFGEGIKVVEPEYLKRRITERINDSIDIYNTELSSTRITSLSKRLAKKGFEVFNLIYTQREIKKIKIETEKKQLFSTELTFIELKSKEVKLFELIFNKNLFKIIKTLESNILTINFHKQIPELEWFQNKKSLLIYLDSVSENKGAHQIVPKSHNKKLSKKEIKLITDNCIPNICQINAGGILIKKENILHKVRNKNTNKNIKLIELKIE